MADDKNIKMTASDFNLEKLSTKELSDHVDSTIQLGGNISVFGRRGTGKTEIAKQQIKKANMKEAYINLSVLERVDMGGYPNIMSSQLQKKFVDFLLPQFYEPMMEGEQGVVALLDEVDKADPSLWAPLLEFTQFRSINNRPLPNLAAIIMTGNLVSEGGARPSLPLLDRAEKYLVEADASSWLDWAGSTGHIHAAITSYINDNPQDLFGNVDPEDRYADPSPRGWSRASHIIFRGESFGWDPDKINKKVAGCVGKEAALKYKNYYTHYKKLLPMVENIFQGFIVNEQYARLELSEQLVTCMMVCARLASILDNTTIANPPPTLGFVGKFLQGVSYENILVAVRSQIQLARIVKYQLDSHPDWKPFMSTVTKQVVP